MGYLNFPLFLFILSVISGGIVCLNAVYLQHCKQRWWVHKIVENARAFFPIFLSVLLLRSFLIEPFRIPSGSLEPSLRVGDFVAVNKFSYGIRLPILEKKIGAWGKPQLGDVAVFRWPADPRLDFIKRVIGQPGDTISYHDKTLRINGVEAKKRWIRYTTDESSGRPVSEYEETLGSMKHRIYLDPDAPAQDFDITIPAHTYFMMGDNRDDSADSRFWGVVDDVYLRGKAFFIWMSWDHTRMSPRWHRIGKRAF